MAKVLIVDDDKEISSLISLILKKENIDTDIVNNPLDVFKKIDNSYDLVLLDIMMPEMSGTEVCLKIRNKIIAAITRSTIIPIISPMLFFFENIFTNFLISFSSMPSLWYSFFFIFESATSDKSCFPSKSSMYMSRLFCFNKIFTCS